MRVFIAGIDGYLGWPFAQYLAASGHEVGGVDGYQRRKWVSEIGSQLFQSYEIKDMSFIT